MEDKKGKKPQITESKSWLDEVLEEISEWRGKREEKKTSYRPTDPELFGDQRDIMNSVEKNRKKNNGPSTADVIFKGLLMMCMGFFSGLMGFFTFVFDVIGRVFLFVARYFWWIILLGAWWIPTEWFDTAPNTVDEVINTESTTESTEELTDSLEQMLQDLSDAVDGLNIRIKINDGEVLEFGAPTDTPEPEPETPNE